MRQKIYLVFFLLGLAMPKGYANEVEIVKTEFLKSPGSWTALVTLRHADTGWDHYADGWRVVGKNGVVYGHRTLAHPHVKEQPFTRSLRGIKIPRDIVEVYVEAHDKVHGWSRQRLRVRLDKPHGDRFKVR